MTVSQVPSCHEWFVPRALLLGNSGIRKAAVDGIHGASPEILRLSLHFKGKTKPIKSP
jgi:hypothetical protein